MLLLCAGRVKLNTMELFVTITVKVKNMQVEEKVNIGDFVVLKEGGTVYQFQGYGHDTIYVKDLETGEEKELSWW